MNDVYGRRFKTLRVSLLHHCNLGCVYCVAGESELKQANVSGKEQQLSGAQLLDIVRRLHAQLDLDTVRLTGGEPLLYPGLVELVKGIRESGISRLKLTTNGFLLERMALPLAKAGMQSINVSLDAIDEEVFVRMSRRHHVDRIIRGIDAALEAGLAVKINSVAMKGLNDSQLLPLTEFAFSRKIPIRFLEIMAMGHLHDQAHRFLLNRDQILEILSSRYTLQPVDRAMAATARYWKTEQGQVIGIIANESEPFCRDCDRLRLDSSGNIYGCLSSNHPIPLQLEESADVWETKLAQALAQKQLVRFTGSDLSMLHIGG
ncbi:MAG: radical SAM protein [Bacteroidetes bacterium]|nr:radical SAM protein [Bacteroidota bacterium]